MRWWTLINNRVFSSITMGYGATMIRESKQLFPSFLKESPVSLLAGAVEIVYPEHSAYHLDTVLLWAFGEKGSLIFSGFFPTFP